MSPLAGRQPPERQPSLALATWSQPSLARCSESRGKYSSAQTTLSLSWELQEIERAVGAARILINEYESGHFPDEHSERESLPAAEAVMSLVGARLRDLCRALGGNLDPARLFATHNDRSADDKPTDVFLAAWSTRQIRSQLAQIDRNLRRKKAGH